MRRVIQQRIRKRAPGFDLALDLNADIAINLNRSGPPPPRTAERRHTAGQDGRRGTRPSSAPERSSPARP